MSPFVDFTSKTPSPISSIEMSNVPPPRSYTAILLVLLLVETVGERRRRRLVDDAQDLEPGDLAGVLRGLALGVVEVGGHGDDGLRDLLAEVVLGRLLHLLQDEGGDLGGRYFLPPRLDPGVAVVGRDDLVRHQLRSFCDHRVVELSTHEALDGVDGVLRVGDGLTLGRPARPAAHRPCVNATTDGVVRAPSALAMTFGLPAFHHGDTRVGGAEIDADDLAHVLRRDVGEPLNTVRRMATLTTVNLRTGDGEPMIAARATKTSKLTAVKASGEAARHVSDDLSTSPLVLNRQ